MENECLTVCSVILCRLFFLLRLLRGSPYCRWRRRGMLPRQDGPGLVGFRVPTSHATWEEAFWVTLEILTSPRSSIFWPYGLGDRKNISGGQVHSDVWRTLCTVFINFNSRDVTKKIFRWFINKDERVNIAKISILWKFGIYTIKY